MKNNLRKLILIQLLLLIFLPLFAQDYFTQLRDSGKWVLKEYFDILYEKDKEKLLECFPAVEENYVQINYLSEDNIVYRWDSEWFSETVYEILFDLGGDDVCRRYKPNDKLLKIGDYYYNDFFVTEETITIEKQFVVSYKAIQYFNFEQGESIIDFPQTKDGKKYTLKFVFEGDFFDFYINDFFIHKFCRMDSESLKEYSRLIETGVCDLSKVTWPRHADGTCDYDKTIKEPQTNLLYEELEKAFDEQNKKALQLSGEETKEIILKPVKKKGIKTVSVKTEIRLKPSTEEILMTEINPGSKVNVIKIGKKAVVGNIKSNWVKVRVQKGARKGKNNDIPVLEDTEGWMFGGYLE